MFLKVISLVKCPLTNLTIMWLLPSMSDFMYIYPPSAILFHKSKSNKVSP